MNSTTQQDQPAPRLSLTRRTDHLRRRLVAGCFRYLLEPTERALCRPGELPAHGIHRVLVCRPNHRLGNTLLVSPLLSEIEALYPGAEIDVICGGDAGASLFAHRFALRHCYSLPRKIARHLWATIRLLRALRRESWDLAIDASIDSQSGRLLLAIVKARYKLGFPDDASPLAAAWHEHARPEHLAQRSVALLRTAHAGAVHGAYPPLNLRLLAAEREQARAALQAILGGPVPPACPRTVVGVFANATGAKRYGADWWAQFIDTLQARQPDVCIINLVAEHGQSQLDDRHPTYYTRNPRRLAAVIACLDAYISADCGVMHLAVAAGTPTLGIFSTTSATKYGPYGAGHAAIEAQGMNAADVATVAADWLQLATRVPLAADSAPAAGERSA